MPLYPYQERVKELIQNGRSVILQAPTGAGKTRAALSPFIEGFFDLAPDAFPRKCVYSVPMRVLANQFVAEYQEHAATYQRVHRREMRVKIQTGEQSDDARLEGDLIFCTIDQFLSSYLTMPYSLPNRLANLNAGAMVGAYTVFDEFHLLDPGSTLPSVFYTLKQLRLLAPVLLMTATFSTTMLDTLAKELEAEVVLVSADEARQIETREGKIAARQRIWRTAEAALSAEAVLEMHQTRSLALCNTVRNAQWLFRDLRQLIAARQMDTRVILLHSRFLSEDRRRLEDELRRYFGKEAVHSGSFIGIATQTIEVGVDITCETLHTELAPASALIQRAGRCARYPGEQGQVIVYPVEKASPYQELHAAEMPMAFEWLQNHNGEVFDFDKEQALVDAIATPRDQKVLIGLSAGRQQRAEAINLVLHGDRQGDAQRLLVREADSRLVLIHSAPDALLKNPFGATGFNIQTSTLYGMLKDWLDREADVEWRVKYLEADPDPDESNRSQYGWLPLTAKELLARTRAVVVNPVLAGYSQEEGFLADQSDTIFESRLLLDVTARTWDGLSYRLESYEDHIALVLKSFHDVVLPELWYPALALERATAWPHGSVLRAAWLVCLLHDVGKLNRKWQDWAHAYQQQIGSPISSRFAAAHTDSQFDNPAHRKAAQAIRRTHPKPNHAGESALAASRLLVKALDCEPLARAALTAIVRHHTPFAKECGPYRLEPRACDHIQATVNMTPPEVRQWIDLGLLRLEATAPLNSFSNLLIEPGQTHGWLAYTLLARALRRADQAGTAQGTH